ncbi:MAG: hypothetical protein JWO94_620, partial [Verrucomicrobiaceae bacterium]|nr:hypothetical protein [Verrucomicrobiaceae bacterium]
NTTLEWKTFEPAAQGDPRRPMLPQEFHRLIAQGRPTRFKRCDFAEGLDLKSAHVPNALHFEDCVFQKLVTAEDGRFGNSLAFVRCELRQSLTLRNAKIAGALWVEGSKIGLPYDEFALPPLPKVDLPAYLPPPPFRSAKWSGLCVDGNLEGDWLEVDGSLDMGHVEIKGALNLRGAQIGLGYYGGRLYVRQATVDGDFELEPATPDPFSPVSRRTVIRGSLSIGASEFHGRVNIRGIEIKGCLHGITVHIKGRVLADCWAHPTATGGDVHRTEIGIHWMERDAEPGGGTRLSNAVDLVENSQPKRGEYASPVKERVSDRVSIAFSDATIDEAVWLQGVRTEGVVDFENARVGASLELGMWPKDVAHRNGQHYPAHLGSNDGNQSLNHRESLTFKNARVFANVVLDTITTTGGINGDNARIGAALLCRPRWAGKNKERAMPSLGCDLNGESLSLYGTHVGSNVDISGSRLEGGMSMRYAKIAGAVIAQRWPLKDHSTGEKEGAAVREGMAISTPPALATQKHLVTDFGFSDEGYSLYLYGCEVGGNVCCQEASLKGVMSIELAVVKGSVIFDGASICTQRGESLEKPAPDVGKPVIGAIFAKALVDNDISLIGARVKGRLTAGGVQVRGSFLLRKTVLADDSLSRTGKNARKNTTVRLRIDLSGAEITGDLDLRGLQMNEEEPAPRNAGAGPPAKTEKKKKRRKIILTDARIGKLRLHTRDWYDGKDQPLVKMDLRGAKFQRLKISRENKAAAQKRKQEDQTLGEMLKNAATWLVVKPVVWMKGLGLDIADLVKSIVRFIINVLRTCFVVKFVITFLRTVWRLIAPAKTKSEPKVGEATLKTATRSRRVSLVPSKGLVCYGVVVVALFAFRSQFQSRPFFNQYMQAVKWMLALLLVIVILGVWRELRRAIRLRRVFPRRENVFVDLLQLMKPFDIATYICVENDLVNQGEPEKADELHYAMRRRELLLDRTKMPFLRWLWKFAYFKAAGSGTRVQMLLFIHLLIFLFSWLAVFSNPGSVEHPSTFAIPVWEVTRATPPADKADSPWNHDRRFVWADHNGSPEGYPWGETERTDYIGPDAAAKGKGAPAAQSSEGWSQSDGFWVALNVQVPLIHLWARDQWQAASKPGYWGTWFHIWPLFGLQYETFAGLIQLFSYLTLPMLIASLGRAFKRREAP